MAISPLFLHFSGTFIEVFAKTTYPEACTHLLRSLAYRLPLSQIVKRNMMWVVSQDENGINSYRSASYLTSPCATQMRGFGDGHTAVKGYNGLWVSSILTMN